MKLIRRIKLFYQWPKKDKHLFLISILLFWYFFIRVKLLGYQNAKLKKHLGNPTPLAFINNQTIPTILLLHRIKVTLNRLIKLFPLKNTCLILALTGRRLLQRENLGHGELYLGIRKDTKKKSGWVTHAWLMHGKYNLVGGKEKNTYGILGIFQETI